VAINQYRNQLATWQSSPKLYLKIDGIAAYGPYFEEVTVRESITVQRFGRACALFRFDIVVLAGRALESTSGPAGLKPWRLRDHIQEMPAWYGIWPGRAMPESFAPRGSLIVDAGERAFSARRPVPESFRQ
jgi:hypothetical protein